MDLPTRVAPRTTNLVSWLGVVLAWVAAASALGAVFAVLWLGRDLRELVATRAGHTDELQILWQVDAEWNTDAMVERRAEASSALLEQRESADVEEIFRFFDELGYLVRKYRIDPELVWYRFYWPAVCYWKASDFLRRTERDSALGRYVHFSSLVDSLQLVERRRAGGRDAGGPTAAQVRDYLLNEARGRSCSDDTGEPSDEPAYMTPL